MLFLFSFIVARSPLHAQDSKSSLRLSAEEVPLQVIVVRSTEEAQEILNRLKKGESFAQLAREKLTDPTANAGGFMGTFNPAGLRAELREALRGLGPGQISPIAHIPSGYAILRVEEAGGPAREADPGRAQPFAATGTVKYAPDVSGLSEVEAALIPFPKPTDWTQDPRTISGPTRAS